MKLFLMRVVGLVLIVVCVASCDYNYTFEQVKGKDLYVMEFPDFMEEVKDKALSPLADLQYVNYFRNVYAVVIDTPKTKLNLSVEQWADSSYNELIKVAKRPQKIRQNKLEINGMPAVEIIMTGDLGREAIKERIYYHLVFVEGKDHMYHISLWTWDSWREKYLEFFDRIVQSFKEV
ncbi:MAG: PsbP-related protein [Chitinophagales bacterium]